MSAADDDGNADETSGQQSPTLRRVVVAVAHKSKVKNDFSYVRACVCVYMCVSASIFLSSFFRCVDVLRIWIRGETSGNDVVKVTGNPRGSLPGLL